MRTVKISERIERAVQQRLFLVDVSAPTTCPDNGGLLVKLRVLGSTGKYRILMSALYLKKFLYPGRCIALVYTSC